MIPSCLLVANRGEVAVRVLRAAAELGIRTVAVYSEDEAGALHTRLADEAVALRGTGAAPFLDSEQILAAAKGKGCDAIHPGYGFLSESAAFGRRCREEGIVFVGPRVEILELFGDKVRAREQAAKVGLTVLPGTPGPTSLEEARTFFRSLSAGAAIIIKAIAGGGGRGVRVVESLETLPDAYARCRSEAQAAFGNGDLYVEELVRRARHIEVQIIGDGSGAVSQLGERDCSIQRRHQKLVEVAPAPGLPPSLRKRILAAAVRLAQAVNYDNLGTFEFLVDAASLSDDSPFAFIEANPRLQVEHTITEEVTGLDLVRLQLELAAGAPLGDLGLRQDEVPSPRGFAIQVRVNMETLAADGSTLPSAGTLTAFDPPAGPGIRVDTFGYAGYRTNLSFDSLLAKVIAHTSRENFADAVTRCERALAEFRVQGVSTNIPFLQGLLQRQDFREGRLYTRFIDDNLETLVAEAKSARRPRYVEPPAPAAERPAQAGLAGARVNPRDPLAVLDYGRGGAPVQAAPEVAPLPPAGQPPLAPAPAGTVAVEVPLQGTVVSLEVKEGQSVRAGQVLLVLESMKMEHEVRAQVSGIVRQIGVQPGEALYPGHPALYLEEVDAGASGGAQEQAVDLDRIRPDLAEVERRRRLTLDESRPKAVESRHSKGQRTARENVADLCDPGTFVQYGPMAVAMGLRGSVDDLLQYSPADGMVMGLASVNGDLVGSERSRCVVMSYDYTVLAGTQGGMNHKMKDRMFEVAEKMRLPLVFFAEGGGGRAGGGSRNAPEGFRGENSGQITGGGGLSTPSFNKIARLSGLVPVVGVVSGRCFAGNASLLGCCDVIIATQNTNLGMGGPAMIEGGGLGVFRPEDVGPISVQVANGVVDVAVADEPEAVRVAKKYLSYFQGPLDQWECADQRLLRTIIPENRLRVYDVRHVIETLADTGSVLELRRGFGLAMVTALIRVEGRPVGVIANNPQHLSGAIDSPAADKAARFMTLCDAFDIPILLLCDTPGIMVGPEVEKTALVRHANRLFVVGASITVPTFTIILRKAYGLGAQTMGGGNHKMPIFTICWPTAEFGGMGLEGQVKLGRRRELEAAQDPEERRQLYERLVAQAYERGKGLNAAHVFEADDVIDPADSRRWIVAGLRSAPPPAPRTGKKRPCIDAW